MDFFHIHFRLACFRTPVLPSGDWSFLIYDQQSAGGVQVEQYKQVIDRKAAGAIPAAFARNT